MTTTYFSIVIPVYNRAHLIERTIDSVLSQTWNDFELLVVDDGSTDDISSVLRRITDSRLRFVQQANAGANAARNHGISLARGKYIALLDSDDRFLPLHLANAASTHVANPDAVVYAPVIVDRGDGVAFVKPPRGIRPNEHMSEYLLCDRGFLQTSTIVVPTLLARAVRYDETLPYGQDTDFAIRLYAAGATFVMLPTPSAVWNDAASPSRISAHHDPAVREEWLERMQEVVTRRAYLGCRGWHLARALARSGDRARAVRLYMAAAFRGVYSPRLAATIGLQLLLSPEQYRKVADRYLSSRGGKPTSPESSRPIELP